MVDERRLVGFNKGVRACIAWLHARANEMNDPHAKAVLNSAAFSLGVDKPASLADALEARAPESGGDDLQLRLAKFAKHMIAASWDGCAPDGADIQDAAHAQWLILETKYDPDIHTDNDGRAGPGDDWFVLAPDVLAAIAQPAGRSGGEWRPITEAPMDGRDVLITSAGYGMLVRIGFWDEARGGLWSIWPGREAAMRPTHFMPLPAPPTGEPYAG